MAPGHILQIFLRVTVQNQICIAQRVIIDKVVQFSLLDFYKDHAEFYLALYHAGLSNIMLETILGYFDRSPEIPNGLAYLNSAIGYMLYGWVHEWMCRGMQESGTELARMLAEAQKK